MADYSTESLGFFVLDYLDQFPGWHGADAIGRALLPALGRKRISQALIEDVEDTYEELVMMQEILVRGYENFDAPMQATLRGSFFEGKRFLIQPTAMELDEGILIPGHRFHPFISPDIFPGDAQVTYDGRTLSVRTVELTMQDAYIYLSLLGLAMMGMYLAQDNGEAALEDPEITPLSVLKFSAFEMSEIYDDLPANAPLTVVCKDYDEAVFEIELLTDNAPPVMDFGRTTRAVEALDYALEQVFQNFLPGEIPIRTQIALAYGMMEDPFFEHPPLNFGRYLALTEYVRIAIMSYDSLLWRADEDISDELRPGGMMDDDAPDDFLDDDLDDEDFLGPDDFTLPEPEE